MKDGKEMKTKIYGWQKRKSILKRVEGVNKIRGRNKWITGGSLVMELGKGMREVQRKVGERMKKMEQWKEVDGCKKGIRKVQEGRTKLKMECIRKKGRTKRGWVEKRK